MCVPRELLTPRLSCHCGVWFLLWPSCDASALPRMSARLQHHNECGCFANSTGRWHHNYAGGGIANFIGPLQQRSGQASEQIESDCQIDTTATGRKQRFTPHARGRCRAFTCSTTGCRCLLTPSRRRLKTPANVFNILGRVSTRR